MVHLYGLRRGRDRIVVEFTPMQSEPITAKKKLWVRIPLMARCTWYNIRW